MGLSQIESKHAKVDVASHLRLCPETAFWQERKAKMGITTTLTALVSVALQTQTPARPAEMIAVVRAAQNTSMSAADREKLIGKEYIGLVAYIACG